MTFNKKYLWVIHLDCCGSGQFPILIKELEYTLEMQRKSFSSFNVDWSLFTLKTSTISLYASAKGVEENVTTWKCPSGVVVSALASHARDAGFDSRPR